MENLSAPILVIFLAAAASPAIAKQFTPDYTYNSNTDAFYKLHTDAATVLQARVHCQSEGADLMDPTNPTDLEQLVNMKRQHPGIEDVYIANEGQKYDPDLTKVYFVDSLEHVDDVVHKRIDCRVMTPHGVINAAPCNKTLPYICKVKARDIPCNADCDYNVLGYAYEKLTSSYYRVSSVKTSWDVARVTCQAEGGHLLVLRNQQEQEVVKKLVQKVPESVEKMEFFVGLYAEKTSDGSRPVFKTIFNKTLEEVGFAPWAEGEPNFTNSAEYCGTFLKHQGKYNDYNCEILHPFVCQKEVQFL